VVSEEGADVDMRDEEDDLLEAAEKLGIELSGVRAEDEDANGDKKDSEDDKDADKAKTKAGAKKGDE
jgi:DNA-directed RNA polymerase subunit beta